MLKFDLIERIGEKEFKRSSVESISLDNLGASRIRVFGSDVDYTRQSNAVLLQSTELFDKAGREIYHDHILKAEDGKLFQVLKIGGAFCIFENDEAEPTVLFDKVTRQYEVVGDAYQNADLVGVDNPFEKKNEESKETDTAHIG